MMHCTAGLWRRCALLAWIGALLAAGGGARADVLASSTFDKDDEGWRILFRNDRLIPQYIPQGGNPDGYVSGDDDHIGGNRWFWEAPPKFLGDLSAAYGGDLGFDLISLPGEGLPEDFALFTRQDVLLARGDMLLSYDDPQQPGEAWTEFHVGLRETGWLNESTGLPATRDDMRFVLSNLESLLLRGDYTGGNQVNGLDNVVITPEPATLLLMALGAFLAIRRGHT